MRSPEELQHTYPAMDGESHRGHEIFLCRKGMVEALRWVMDHNHEWPTAYQLKAAIDAEIKELEGDDD